MHNRKYKASVNCITYNQSAYIKDTLDGFCSQKTDFPFVCVIMDDYSTDGEQCIIDHYLESFFNTHDKCVTEIRETDDYLLKFSQHSTNSNCFFAVLFFKYNHYQIDKPKSSYCAEWFDNADYMFFCEGDDYWIDPYKMQKQVDILDGNKQCSMVISNGFGLHMSNGTRTLTNPLSGDVSRYATTSEILVEPNGLIPTASIGCRKEFFHTPDVFHIKHIGDKPLKMWCAINGSVFYDTTPMVVHRVGAPGSFGRKVDHDKEYAREVFDNMTAFFNRFNVFTKGEYNMNKLVLISIKILSFCSRNIYTFK